MRRPFSIFCDWAMHDELGDAIELDEPMTLRALDVLERWQREFGLRFDYYLLDAFWFDPAAPYTALKKPHWPAGFEHARHRMLALGMKPGLWYDVNASWLNAPEWQGSLSARGRGFSLAEGPYAASLERAWRYALETWEVRLFKLDFANFYIQKAGSELTPEENYARSAAVLRDILGRLRREYPDLGVIAYNGFERWPGYLGSPIGLPLKQGFDLSWLGVCDYLYSGDPRLSDLPRSDLRRSIDIFQDHQVWVMRRNGFPFERIDDHGCMVGASNTAFYQGSHGFKRTYLGSLARGGQRDIYYGDPSLLNDAEVRFMTASRRLYFGAYERGLTSSWVGGEPGYSAWHGVLTGGAASGLFYLVNGSCSRQQVKLELPGLRRAAVLCADLALDVPLAVGAEQLTVEVLPEQMVLVGLGEYADAGSSLGICADSLQPAEMRPLTITWEWAAPDLLRGSYQGSWQAGASLLVYAQACMHPQATPWKLAGAGWPERFGQEMTKAGERPATSAAHRQVEITVETGTSAFPSVSELPSVPIWAGISWVGRYYQIEESDAKQGFTITIRQRLEPLREIIPSAYMVTLI
ncbi:MAG: alpha-amylase family protein [Anaerolineae bacterium]